MLLVEIMLVTCVVLAFVDSVSMELGPLAKEIRKNPKSAKKFIIFCVVFVLLIILGSLIDKNI